MLIDAIMDGSKCGSKISKKTNRLPTGLVNVKTTDTVFDNNAATIPPKNFENTEDLTMDRKAYSRSSN